MNLLRMLRAHPGALVVPVIAVFLFGYPRITASPQPLPNVVVAPTTASSSPATVASTSAPTSPLVTKKPTKSAATTTVQKVKKASIQAEKSTSTTSPNEIVRIENPYTSPPLPFESINVSARAALVNILCTTKSEGALKPITGSGIIVDAHGIILTNAHVAQYVLIAQSGRSNLECFVRTGSPAVAMWVPVVMYIPAAWVNVHASEILQSHAVGTGEHDYALLYIAATIDGRPLPSSFSAITPDSREAIGFVDDTVLAASYPVEFIGGTTVQSDLYQVTSIARIQRLLTFSVGAADALSLGGIIGAQSGSSGGGVLNQWNRLIGLITTTSDGATTAERDLHAISTAYINRDIRTQTGRTLAEVLASDPKMMADAFRPEAAVLAGRLINSILGH